MAKRRGISYDETDRQVGLRLKVQRLDLGLSQEAVGTKIGLTYQQVQKYEKGSTSLVCARVPEMCGIYGLTPNDLFVNVIPNDLEARQAKRVAAMSSRALRIALEYEKLSQKQRIAVEAFMNAMKP